jgi:hypothetical protein
MKIHPAAHIRAVIGLSAVFFVSCGGGGYGGDGGGSNPPATLTISVSPSTITLGQSATVTWSSNAANCTASGAWTGSRPSSGSETVTPATPGTLTYTLVCGGGGYRESEAGSATLTVDAAAIAALWIGDGCCIESESFQVTGLTSDTGDFQFLLPGSHFVGKHGNAMAAFSTCDSCLTGKARTDLRDFKLLRIAHQAIERPSGVAALQGIYTTNLGTGYTLTITVDTSGLVTGTDTNGCSLHGQIDDFDLALNVSACDDSSGRYYGKAALIPGGAGRATELFLSASNADAAIGWRLSR